MGIFSKNRKDAKWVKPNDAIGAIVPFIMDRRTDSEVSSKSLIDVTKLCEFVDKQNNERNLEYKMTYFHTLTAAIGMTVFNRERLNRFVKNRRLYQRNKITFAFVAKDKFNDKGELVKSYVESPVMSRTEIANTNLLRINRIEVIVSSLAGIDIFARSGSQFVSTKEIVGIPKMAHSRRAIYSFC